MKLLRLMNKIYIYLKEIKETYLNKNLFKIWFESSRKK